MVFDVDKSWLHPPSLLHAPNEKARAFTTFAYSQSSLTRSVYCILGLPIDAIDLATVAYQAEAATAKRETLLVSTPNLNFLVNSLSDSEFRESLLNSDLCPPDGMPIIWIARLLGLPIRERAAGADLLERLQTRGRNTRQIALFLFGGAEGVAAAAAKNLNSRRGGLHCVGSMNPGFGGVGEMSQDHIIDAVNSSGADFLVVSLGAKKGQLWLQRNHRRLKIPVRSHLGAAINFQAGTVKRAPQFLRMSGFEWLWRVKEERYLWRRYRDDGFVFARLLLTRVLPFVLLSRWQHLRWKQRAPDLLLRVAHHDRSIAISLRGAALESHVPAAILRFQEILAGNKDIVVDLSETTQIDARFMGLLLMLRKELRSRGRELKLSAVPRAIERLLRLNELGFLLDTIDRDRKISVER
jgi:N-acetylglucosaminyldiphosphoundecaprenol N-acetyl-beta-D-mannosaminyltransferase